MPQRTRGRCAGGGSGGKHWLSGSREGVAITGLHAREDLCQAFFPAYQGEFLLDTAMEILTLRELIPPACVPGLARTATLADLETVARMLQAFQREALGKETTLEAMAEKSMLGASERGKCTFRDPRGHPCLYGTNQPGAGLRAPASAACTLRQNTAAGATAKL